MVTAKDGGAINVVLPAGRSQPRASDFIEQYAYLFGIDDPAIQLKCAKLHADTLGWTHTSYQQMHNGVPVFSGMLKVHQAPDGSIVAANGECYAIHQDVTVVPAFGERQAVSIACRALHTTDAEVTSAKLVIIDPAWYGDPPRGARPAYRIELRDWDRGICEVVFVDAESAEVIDHWPLVHSDRYREVYDAQGTAVLPGTLVRSEGDPPVASPEVVNQLYDYLGDAYDFFDRAFGRDGIDDAGMVMSATANYYSIDRCPNAWWDTQLKRAVFCNDLLADDIVAHEITHGITQHTAALIYQNQSGQLNESFSDVFGELVDLFNGDVAVAGPPSGPPYWPPSPTGPGLDTPNNLRTGCSSAPDYVDGVRWLAGEGTAYGVVRDMWDPLCQGDPDYANSLLQKCVPWDSGGVHSGSTICSHAFAMLVDGKTFNGHTVNGIGAIKAGAVWYRTLTIYLTPASDFEDAYHCFNQAAQDLIGTYPNDPRTGLPTGDMFSAVDAGEVDKALLAVEMNTTGRCGATVGEYDAAAPDECSQQHVLYQEDFEGGAAGWTMTSTAPPAGDGWILVDQLPELRPGTAWYCEDIQTFDVTDVAASQLFSPTIPIPPGADEPLLSFLQYAATVRRFDGGNVHVSVNGGPWMLIPTCLYQHNAPHWTAIDTLLAVHNEPIFCGTSDGWFTSLVDLGPLVHGGDVVQFMFEFADRFYSRAHGWYIDDVKLYACTCGDAGDCPTNGFCDGVYQCPGGYCVTVEPCPQQACDEDADTCLPTALYEDFESGNVQGWQLRGSGSTAVEGDWIIGDPNGMFYLSHPIQPMTAYEGCSCAFTGEGPVAGQYFNGDVDDGVVYLVSPAIDLAGQDHALLSYAWWWSVQDATRNLVAAFTVEASPDDGLTWYPLTVISEEPRDGTWNTDSHRLESVIPLTSAVRVRFGAEEDTTCMSDTVEAAVDHVIIALVDACVVGPGDSDCNSNGVADWCDVADDASFDCNSNGVPDECDIASTVSPDCQPNGVPDECEITRIRKTISFPLSSDPGWTTEGLWSWGRPIGHGSDFGGYDPIYGYTGNNVYGYNLEGLYEANLPEMHLTTPPIDCSDIEHVGLSFWRWLWVETPPYDHASLRVSNDGAAWVTVWENAGEVGDWPWVNCEYDISAIADRQPTVFVRWTMGPTDDNYQFAGWNIDDVALSGDLIIRAFGDCNVNGVPDECDIAGGTSQDANGDGVPDECALADIDGDGDTDLVDFEILAGCLSGPGGGVETGCELTDLNGDADVDLRDFALFAIYLGDQYARRKICPDAGASLN
ncbi:MAG: M4 family metallopeptidase [Phycisphaerales bacterium]|nr:MAG: M4 family metallopeptidase [Phycisphaerales bacterium]